ncbi:MAG: DUF4340 domain-containing protein [SAR324 cluster bacterium]|nr:DUF4340 domain-containing protein [SAR324 cluster bacterium]
MLQKLSIVTGVTVIFGIALWLVQGNFFSTGGQKKNAAILANLDTEKLSEILIQKDDTEKVELVRGANQQWVVKDLNYEANAKKIQELLLQVLDVKLGEQVTDKAKHHARFHLLHFKENNNQWEEEKTGKLLILKNAGGEPLLELLLGKSRSEKQGFKTGNYIRYADKPEVFLITENIDADTDSKEWLNLNIIDWDGDEVIKSVELKNGDDVFRFVHEKKEEEWKAEGLEEKISQNAVKSLGNALKGLNFDIFIPADTPAEETGRENLVQYTAESYDGRIVRVLVGDKEIESEGKHHYLSVEMALKDGVADEKLQAEVEEFNLRSKPWLYGLHSWMGKRFLKVRSDLLAEDKEK